MSKNKLKMLILYSRDAADCRSLLAFFRTNASVCPTAGIVVSVNCVGWRIVSDKPAKLLLLRQPPSPMAVATEVRGRSVRMLGTRTSVRISLWNVFLPQILGNTTKLKSCGRRCTRPSSMKCPVPKHWSFPLMLLSAEKHNTEKNTLILEAKLW